MGTKRFFFFLLLFRSSLLHFLSGLRRLRGYRRADPGPCARQGGEFLLPSFHYPSFRLLCCFSEFFHGAVIFAKDGGEGEFQHIRYLAVLESAERVEGDYLPLLVGEGLEQGS